MNKYKNSDGEIGVIVSPGFGAGWSTWGGSCDAGFLLMDKTLVEMCLRSAPKSQVEEYLTKKGIDTYIGGWEDCEIEYLRCNTPFYVDEYDGSESLIFAENLTFNTGE